MATNPGEIPRPSPSPAMRQMVWERRGHGWRPHGKVTCLQLQAPLSLLPLRMVHELIPPVISTAFPAAGTGHGHRERERCSSPTGYRRQGSHAKNMTACERDAKFAPVKRNSNPHPI